jgi:hypothetical protein
MEGEGRPEYLYHRRREILSPGVGIISPSPQGITTCPPCNKIKVRLESYLKKYYMCGVMRRKVLMPMSQKTKCMYCKEQISYV